MKATRTERGWAGHFICANDCRFHRNTLISFMDRKIVVSTVGNLRRDGKMETIGAFGRYYETMAFEATEEGAYIEANVSEQLSFNSEWEISYENFDDMPEGVDNIADKMHEAVVNEFIASMEAA